MTEFSDILLVLLLGTTVGWLCRRLQFPNAAGGVPEWLVMIGHLQPAPGRHRRAR